MTELKYYFENALPVHRNAVTALDQGECMPEIAFGDHQVAKFISSRRRFRAIRTEPTISGFVLSGVSFDVEENRYRGGDPSARSL
jgi:hypothetical protein